MIPQLQIDDFELEQVNQTKFLGLFIDGNLSWDCHVKHVSSKISSGLYALRHMSFLAELETLKVIYFSLIQSHISYGLNIYGNTSKSNLDSILLLQKQAIRIMLKLHWRETVKNYFKEIGIMTVYTLFIFQTVCYTKEHYVQHLTIDTNHEYFTRNWELKIKDSPNLEFGKKKTITKGLKFMKKLPLRIRNENNLTKFKRVLKKLLVQCPLYSFEEFENLNFN